MCVYVLLCLNPFLAPPNYMLVSFCTILHCSSCICIALNWTALCCAALHCTALHCIALHCIALHFIALQCVVLNLYHIVLQFCFVSGSLFVCFVRSFVCLLACLLRCLLSRSLSLRCAASPRFTIARNLLAEAGGHRERHRRHRHR